SARAAAARRHGAQEPLPRGPAGQGRPAAMRLGAALASALHVATSARAQEAPQQAPFITTPPEVVARMLELARTGPADVVLDLGSGDGRIVFQAARVHGARGLGVVLDPALVARARENAARA